MTTGDMNQQIYEALKPAIEREIKNHTQGNLYHTQDGRPVQFESLRKQRVIWGQVSVLITALSALLVWFFKLVNLPLFFPWLLLIVSPGYCLIFLLNRKVTRGYIMGLLQKQPKATVAEVLRPELAGYKRTAAWKKMLLIGLFVCSVAGFIWGAAADILPLSHPSRRPNEYQISGDGCIITSAGGANARKLHLEIPAQLDGYDVVAIGEEAFADFTMLQSITLPDSLQEIGPRAFENCVWLESITIPDSVTVIRSGAFRGCTNLKTVIWGDQILEVEGECFMNCTSLESIRIPAGVTAVRGNTFEGCTRLEEVILHDNITAIHGYAFRGCKSLTEIQLPSQITEIRGNTFENCSRLESIVIPEGVTRIAAHAFRNCGALKTVYVPDSVRSIGSSAFRGCSSLETIELPVGVEIDERAFKESPTSITYR